jgi:hypothetical protein
MSASCSRTQVMLSEKVLPCAAAKLNYPRGGADDIRKKYSCEHTVKTGFHFRSTGAQERPLARSCARPSRCHSAKRVPASFPLAGGCMCPASELRHVLVEASRSFHQRRCLGRTEGRGEPSLHAFLGKDHGFGPANDEGIGPLEEISDHFRKGLRPFNHQGVACVINEH